jgi:hypothetical protein
MLFKAMKGETKDKLLGGGFVVELVYVFGRNLSRCGEEPLVPRRSFKSVKIFIWPRNVFPSIIFIQPFI